MKYFMLDIETMGTDPESDDILEIGILEMNEINGFYYPGKSYNRKLFTSQKPKNDWIATNHRELIKSCQKVPMVSPATVRNEILEYFKNCGQSGPPMLVGLNLMSLDIPFMVAKEFLRKGDYHYRVYELRGTLNTAVTVLRIDERDLYSAAEAMCPEIQLPEGKKHEALYDCYRQLKALNGIVRLLRA